MSVLRETTAKARELLGALAEGDVRLVAGDTGWRLVPSRAPDATGRVVDAGFVAMLLERGLLHDIDGAALPTKRGLRFAGVGKLPTPIAGKPKTARAPANIAQGETPAVNHSESPIAWLRRRKGRDGEPLISAAAFQAAERLRADYTRAGLMPRVTADLSGSAPRRGRKAGGRGPADMLDAALAAHDRVRRALDDVGGDLAGLTVDVCCHLKSLGDVERERGWPKRSAKVVLDLALGRLARHYGLSDDARGPHRARRLHHWGSEDYRPRVDGA